MKTPIVHYICAALALGSLEAQAGIMAIYNFTGSSRASSDTDSFSTAGSFADGPGFSGGYSFISSSGNPAPSIDVGTGSTGNSEAASIAANAYYSFTLTPNPSITLGFTNFSFDIRDLLNGTSSITTTWALRLSIDGFSTTIGSRSTTSDLSTQPSNPWTNASIDLSSLSPQSAAVEFRLYGFDNSSVSNDNQYIDNVILSANVVPEPSTALFGVFSALAFMLRRNRNQRRA